MTTKDRLTYSDRYSPAMAMCPYNSSPPHPKSAACNFRGCGRSRGVDRRPYADQVGMSDKWLGNITRFKIKLQGRELCGGFWV
jgi:hypothetical protein